MAAALHEVLKTTLEKVSECTNKPEEFLRLVKCITHVHLFSYFCFCVRIFCSKGSITRKPLLSLNHWPCGFGHKPYSRQVTERMEYNVIHPPPSVYPKAGNSTLRDQWAIKYHCQKDSLTIVFTVRDLVTWNYCTSENIPRVCKSHKSLLIYVFATYFFSVPPTFTPLN